MFRFYIIYGSNLYYLIIPGILFLASVCAYLMFNPKVDIGLTHLAYLVFSILEIISDFTLSPSFWKFATPIPADTVFFACTAALNVVLTGLIVGIIVLYTRSISNSLGNKNVRWSDAVISTMIESSVLFSICAIAAAVTSPTESESQSNASVIILSVITQMTVS